MRATVVWLVLPTERGGMNPRPWQMARALVVTDDPWLRFHLCRELEREGCEVSWLARLWPGELSGSASFDVVLTDAGLLPEGSRLEALRALRAGSPKARFVLLVGPEERALVEQAQRSGFDLVLEKPTCTQHLPERVRQALGRRGTGSRMTSFVLHAVVVGLALLIPLMFTGTFPVAQRPQAGLVGPVSTKPGRVGGTIRPPRRLKPVVHIHPSLARPATIQGDGRGAGGGGRLGDGHNLAGG